MEMAIFTEKHIRAAQTMAKENYEEERRKVPVLPAVEVFPLLDEFAGNGLGVCCLESERLLGFLCCYAPWENAFTSTAKGTFSPIHAHGTIPENRERIYKYLYQAAAKKWAAAGISSHAIGLYAHDSEAIHSFFVNGFGLRCIDAIRPMEEIGALPCGSINFAPIPKNEESELTGLRRLLSLHLSESPCFMKDTEPNVEAWIARAISRDSRVFVAKSNGKIIAFIEVIADGENFATESRDMQNICGAFCLPDFRGKNVYPNLLNYVIRTLGAEGYTHLGVDFESFNPTAYGFWLKHFTAYTNSVVRRIDEGALPD